MWGPLASTSAPPDQDPLDDADKLDTDALEKMEVDETVYENIEHTLFCEFFAGGGVLTEAVSGAGVPVAPPDEVTDGGTDFTDDSAMEKLRGWFSGLAADGKKVVVHLAPPCSTFSRARDRSWKTRLRSSQRPQGLISRSAQCREANVIATRTRDLAEWLVSELGFAVTLENPRNSYLWLFLDFDEKLAFTDVVFSPCLYGASYQKPTRVRCWNIKLPSLEKLCTMKEGFRVWWNAGSAT